MIRISTIFIAVCMVLISASLGMALYGLLGLSGSESAIVALTALTFLILYNAVAMRLRDRTDVGGQIADLSRGTADLARQVAEFGRRLIVVEQKLGAQQDTTSPASSQIQPLMAEINELGSLVRQLAVTVSSHDETVAGLRNASRATPPTVTAPAAAPTQAPVAAMAAAAVATLPQAESPMASDPLVVAPAATEKKKETAPIAAVTAAPRQVSTAVVKDALEANRIDLYLQPMVTLPQRKVRYYEAVARLRPQDGDQVMAAAEFLGAAESAGLLAQIDHLVLFRCVQVLRRLLVRSKDIGIFCNFATSTLGNDAVFSQCVEFLEANRAIAPSFILEFTQSAFRKLGPAEIENLAKLSQLGFRFSIDNVVDLNIDPRELADRSVRFIKIPATLLLEQNPTGSIHPADLSDLLGRYGIDLIAERIEGERAVVDLLDYDVRYGQGFLFSPPRPVRPDQPAYPVRQAEPARSAETAPPPKADPSLTRTGGISALARRIAGPN